jgi:hypothetical protein
LKVVAYAVPSATNLPAVLLLKELAIAIAGGVSAQPARLSLLG